MGYFYYENNMLYLFNLNQQGLKFKCSDLSFVNIRFMNRKKSLGRFSDNSKSALYCHGISICQRKAIAPLLNNQI